MKEAIRQGKRMAACCVLASAVFGAFGGELILNPTHRNWTGGAGNGLWSDPLNWADGTKPGEDDIAVFENGTAGAVINVNEEVTLGAIYVSGTEGLVFFGEQINLTRGGQINWRGAAGYTSDVDTIANSVPVVISNAIHYCANYKPDDENYGNCNIAPTAELALCGPFVKEGGSVLRFYIGANVTMSGTVSASESLLLCDASVNSSWIDFLGQVTAREVAYSRSSMMNVFFHASGNDFGSIDFSFYGHQRMLAENCYTTNAVLRLHNGGGYYDGDFNNSYNLFNHDQIANRLDCPLATIAAYTKGGAIRSAVSSSSDPHNFPTHLPIAYEPATLTLRGTADAVTTLAVLDKVSLVWDPVGDFTQEFSNRVSTTTGSITVRRGTVRVTGAGRFPNLSGIVLGEGARFDLDSTAAGALQDVKSARIAKDAVLSVAATATEPFAEGVLDLDIEEGGGISIPEGMTVKIGIVRYKGEMVDAGRVESAPWLTGGGAVSVAGHSALSWIVYPTVVDGMTGPQQLTNAIIRCASGTRIVLRPGIYDLTGIVMSNDETADPYGVGISHLDWSEFGLGAGNAKEIHLCGDSAAAWQDRAAEQESVLRGGGNRIIGLNGGGKDRFGLSTLENLVFENGKTPSEIVAWNKRGAGGALLFPEDESVRCIVSNCVLRANSGGWAAANHGGYFIDCQFTNNTANKTVATSLVGNYRDCTFVGNLVPDGYCVVRAWAVSNCTFVANSVGALSLSDDRSAVDSRFVGNTTPGNDPVLSGGNAYGCVFADNNGNFLLDYAYEIADCVFSGNAGSIVSRNEDSLFLRCRFANGTTHIGDVRSGSVKGTLRDCVFDNGGKLVFVNIERCIFTNYNNSILIERGSRISNCLITGCTRPRIYGHWASDEFVNCSFVGNVLGDNLVDNSADGVGLGVRFTNCLFAENTSFSTGESLDVSVKDGQTAGVVFDHCAYKTANANAQGLLDAGTNLRVAESVGWRFNKGKFADFPYWMPRQGSPVADKGLLLDWTAADIDLGGNPRVRNGAVDVGCYENAGEPVSGLMIIVN